MERYKIYCTPKQAKEALELGANITNYPIQCSPYAVPKFEKQLKSGKWISYIIPTAEEMIGWLNIEKKLFVMVRPYVSMYHEDKYDAILINLCNGHMLNVKQGCNSNKEAILAAIDMALKYLYESII